MNLQRIKDFLEGIMYGITTNLAAFLFALLGVIAQTYHTYSIAYTFSSLEGFNKVLQAIILAAFLSGALLFYTIKAGKAKTIVEKDRYNKITTAFAVFESFLNLYYWFDKVIFSATEILWHQLIVLVPMAIAIPVILKYYAGEIKFEDKEKPETQSLDNVQLTIFEGDQRTGKYRASITPINFNTNDKNVSAQSHERTNGSIIS